MENRRVKCVCCGLVFVISISTFCPNCGCSEYNHCEPPHEEHLVEREHDQSVHIIMGNYVISGAITTSYYINKELEP